MILQQFLGPSPHHLEIHWNPEPFMLNSFESMVDVDENIWKPCLEPWNEATHHRSDWRLPKFINMRASWDEVPNMIKTTDVCAGKPEILSVLSEQRQSPFCHPVCTFILVSTKIHKIIQARYGSKMRCKNQSHLPETQPLPDRCICQATTSPKIDSRARATWKHARPNCKRGGFSAGPRMGNLVETETESWW